MLEQTNELLVQSRTYASDVRRVATARKALRRQAEHDRAWERRSRKAVARLESAVQSGLAIFGAIQALEWIWRDCVYSGRLPYRPQDDAAIRGFYVLWAEPGPGMRREIEDFQREGRTVSDADRILQALNSVAPLLERPDSALLDGPRIGLREADDPTIRVREVSVDREGGVKDATGEPVDAGGLTPDEILAGIASAREGRHRPLSQLLASRRP